MGNRRLGAQRLNALLKKGSLETDSSYQAGAGIKNAIYRHSIVKIGGIIETHILVDLQGNGKGEIWNGDTDRDVIGEATANDGTGAVADASLLTWETDVHGVFRSVSVICVEVPTGGVADIGLIAKAGTLASAGASGIADDNARDLFNPDAALTIGTMGGIGGENLHQVDPDADLDLDGTNVVDGDKIYLVCGDSGTGAKYSAGKLHIIFRGSMPTSQWGF